MKLLLDEQLPDQLSLWFNENGFDAATTRIALAPAASDNEIWEAGLQMPAILVTEDKDFLELARQRRSAPRILFLAVGNLRNRDLVTVMKAHLTVLRTWMSDDEPLLTIAPD